MVSLRISHNQITKKSLELKAQFMESLTHNDKEELFLRRESEECGNVGGI